MKIHPQIFLTVFINVNKLMKNSYIRGIMRIRKVYTVYVKNKTRVTNIETSTYVHEKLSPQGMRKMYVIYFKTKFVTNWFVAVVTICTLIYLQERYRLKIHYVVIIIMPSAFYGKVQPVHNENIRHCYI